MAEKFNVSVIIPSRDYGCFLDESIESVLNQTVTPSEIIVVDDGSKDNTREVVKKYFPRVSYYYQENGGVGSARNKGIGISKGDYIAHLDADDIWVPERLELQLEEFIKDPELEITGGMMQPFFSPGTDPKVKKTVYCSPDPLPGFSASVILVKRISFFKVGEYKEGLNVGQDLDWFLRAREIPLKEKMLSKVLALRRLHNFNSSNNIGRDGKERILMLKESLDRRRKRLSGSNGK